MGIKTSAFIIKDSNASRIEPPAIPIAPETVEVKKEMINNKILSITKFS